MTFDPKAFIRELLALEYPDGGDVQALAEKHGILENRPLTAEQIADDDGRWHEHGCEVGDLWLHRTEAYKAWRDGRGQ